MPECPKWSSHQLLQLGDKEGGDGADYFRVLFWYAWILNLWRSHRSAQGGKGKHAYMYTVCTAANNSERRYHMTGREEENEENTWNIGHVRGGATTGGGPVWPNTVCHCGSHCLILFAVSTATVRPPPLPATIKYAVPSTHHLRLVFLLLLTLCFIIWRNGHILYVNIHIYTFDFSKKIIINEAQWSPCTSIHNSPCVCSLHAQIISWKRSHICCLCSSCPETWKTFFSVVSGGTS